jgi:GNAT superfamily N-acetyltransferase
MISIKEIKASEHIDEAWELLELHRQELTTHKHIMVLKPNIDVYKKLEEQGKIYSLALYDDERIVGYSVTMLSPNLHYADLVVAQNDVLFVHPDYRNGMWGIKLIAETKRLGKELGAGFVTFHGKPDTPFSEIMPRLGFGIQDIIYSMEL